MYYGSMQQRQPQFGRHRQLVSSSSATRTCVKRVKRGFCVRVTFRIFAAAHSPIRHPASGIPAGLAPILRSTPSYVVRVEILSNNMNGRDDGGGGVGGDATAGTNANGTLKMPTDLAKLVNKERTSRGRHDQSERQLHKKYLAEEEARGNKRPLTLPDWSKKHYDGPTSGIEKILKRLRDGHSPENAIMGYTPDQEVGRKRNKVEAVRAYNEYIRKWIVENVVPVPQQQQGDGDGGDVAAGAVAPGAAAADDDDDDSLRQRVARLEKQAQATAGKKELARAELELASVKAAGAERHAELTERHAEVTAGMVGLTGRVDDLVGVVDDVGCLVLGSKTEHDQNAVGGEEEE